MTAALAGVIEGVVAAIDSSWRVPFEGAPAFPFEPSFESGDCKQRLEDTRRALRPFQRKLYAAKQFSVLLVFQALDAAGKDGVIREVFEDLDPVNVNVTAFKRPSERELRHDFLWRTGLALPERGEIDLTNLANNWIRFDMAQSISPHAHLRNDPGDSICVEIWYDAPAPDEADGPTIDSVSPLSTVRSTPVRTGTSKALWTLMYSIMA